MNPRLLIIHDESELYVDQIRARFPQLELMVLSHQDEAPQACGFEPQVVFSWKGKSVPHHVQREVITCGSVRWVQIAREEAESL